MNSREFGAYKARYRAAIQQVLSEAEPGRLDEIGFPAYSHANPLISWLFWKRLHTVMDWIERRAPFKSALDFGCGSGVMLPFLAVVEPAGDRSRRGSARPRDHEDPYPVGIQRTGPRRLGRGDVSTGGGIL